MWEIAFIISTTSAMWAGSIASRKNLDVRIFMLIGLIVPVLGVLLAHAMPAKGETLRR